MVKRKKEKIIEPLFLKSKVGSPPFAGPPLMLGPLYPKPAALTTKQIQNACNNQQVAKKREGLRFHYPHSLGLERMAVAGLQLSAPTYGGGQVLLSSAKSTLFMASPLTFSLPTPSGPSQSTTT